MLNHVFTTPILREPTDLTPELRAAICERLLALRESAPGEAKSNRGGWHSEGNLFGPEQPELPGLRDTVTRALFAYIGEVFAFRGEISLALTGWAIVNRPGDYNVPHNHAANLLSGALYLAIPSGMRGGAIVFQDPRLNLNAHETAAMRVLNAQPPWMVPNITVQPIEGEILIFPSWLNHWVEPFQSDDPRALRIVVSFNATIA